MPPVWRYLAIAMCVVSWFDHGYCRAEPPSYSDAKLYFDSHQPTDDMTDNNVLAHQNIKHERETNDREDQTTPDADTETHTNVDIEVHDMVSSNIRNTKALATENIEVRQMNNNFLHVPWWPSFLQAMIVKLNQPHIKYGYQFSFLYMSTTYMPHQNKFPLKFHPRNQDGTPVINNHKPLSPQTRGQYVNYVAARPQNVQSKMIDAEQIILDQMKSLWNSYNMYLDHPPNMIVLYSWLMPSPQSTSLIIRHFSQAPFSSVRYKVVAYTKEGTNSNLAYMTPADNKHSRQRLNDNNIATWKPQCEVPDDGEYFIFEEAATYDADNHMCKSSDTFQGCLVDCLGPDFCCSCKESRRRAMNAVMVNDVAKECATSDIKTCARGWIQKTFDGHHSGADACQDLDTARVKLLSCVDKCVERPLSKPLNPFNPMSFPGYMDEFSDISKYAPVPFNDLCSDIRTDGYLCYRYRTDFITAGNSLCKKGSVCGYKGYSYKWCFTEFGGWDYCCTSTCSYGNNNTMSCENGNHTELCGSPGDVTVKGRRCLAGYPCGMHQEEGGLAYYWCYTDINKVEWDYCCQPGDTCSKKHKDYDWCYTGNVKNTGQRMCGEATL